MQCPLCIDEVLDTRHRSGVEIDVCPRCRGVWLDRGELDRLAGPVAEIPPPAPTAATPRPEDREKRDERSRDRDRERDANDRDDDRRHDDDDDDWDDDDRDYRRTNRKRRRRLGSWLEDVVDEVFD